MQARKRSQILTAGVAVAAFLWLPAAASATPQWRLNGVLAGSAKQEVAQFGTLTLKSKPFGEFKCKIVAGAPAWNESEKGVSAVEGWESFPCSYTGSLTGCKSESLVTAEGEVELIEELNANSEKVRKAKRAAETLPWPGELFETTEKTTSLNLRKIKIYLECPAEGLAVPYEGNLEPKVINGVKNGLSPSRLDFEGKGGKTNYLVTCDIGCTETEEIELFVSGELTMLGAGQQLITAG